MNIPAISDYGLILGEKLGQGSYANVYKAQRRELRPNGTREVLAVKCIAKSKVCVTQTAQDNLVREIDILKKLSHPNIVRLVDFLWDKNNVYLITEYCNAGDLSCYIRQTSQFPPGSSNKKLFSLPEPLTRKFLQQLAAAMRYLRSKQISHMDLKPQNILLTIEYDKSITLKIADFGFATKLSYTDRATSLRGSPLYMAPEMLKGGSYDVRVDLWSIGVIIYECLFGYPPFSSENLNGLINKIVSDEPVIFHSKPSLSPCCRNLVEKLLKKDPRDRITFYEFFDHPFVDEKYSPNFKLFSEVNDHAYLKKDQKSERDELRRIIKNVLTTAEQIKQDLSLPNVARNEDNACQEKKLLIEMWSDSPQFEAAIKVKNFAEAILKKVVHQTCESESDIPIALEKYELCIESLLKILNDKRSSFDPNDDFEKNRLKSLKLFIESSLNRAEEIKNYLEVKRLQFSAKSVEEKEQQAEASVEEKTKRLVDENFCRLHLSPSSNARLDL
uniref:non-specific serine/threonine protein kinase n=1 Tax=Romanomermis culicivorax TaxID=13658 RepID=A0A915KQD6_ROMCU